MAGSPLLSFWSFSIYVPSTLRANRGPVSARKTWKCVLCVFGPPRSRQDDTVKSSERCSSHYWADVAHSYPGRARSQRGLRDRERPGVRGDSVVRLADYGKRRQDG